MALIAVFAALQAVLSLFPFALTMGVAGEITLGLIGGTLIGILLGPVFGGLAVLIGSAVGVSMNYGAALFSVWTVVPPTVGAVAAGCTKQRRGYIAGFVVLIFLLIFYANTIGREVFIYTWFHIVAMIVAFSSVAFVKDPAVDSFDTRKSVVAIGVGVFVGVLADHIAGSAIAMWYFSPTAASLWLGVMLVYPVERIIAFLIAAFIAVPVYYSLVRSGLIRHLR